MEDTVSHYFLTHTHRHTHSSKKMKCYFVKTDMRVIYTVSNLFWKSSRYLNGIFFSIENVCDMFTLIFFTFKLNSIAHCYNSEKCKQPNFQHVFISIKSHVIKGNIDMERCL